MKDTKTMETYVKIADCDHGRQPIVKQKKKPYWVEVEPFVWSKNVLYCVSLKGRNNFLMQTKRAYCDLREAVQMGKRLAKNLGLEFKK